MSIHLLFVYGTLMSGQPNHRFLARATLLGPVRTAPLFRMISLGGYPAIMREATRGASAPGIEIVGELYEVDDETLAACDRLESHPTFYRRQEIALADGKFVQTYILNRTTLGTPIPSGNWREWERGGEEDFEEEDTETRRRRVDEDGGE